MALMEDNIRVIGTKAITKSGTIQGNITELYIGDDGKIEKCEITAPDGTTSDVTSDQISIFGKQVTVIDPSGAEEKKTKPVSVPAPAAPKAEPQAEVPAMEPKAEEKAAEPEPKVEEKPAEAPKAEATPEPKKPEPAKEAPKAAPAKAADPKQAAADKATEERHRRFLLGKKAARTIKMDNGIVIVEAGADITEEVLQKAKLANKFIELSMNVQ